MQTVPLDLSGTRPRSLLWALGRGKVKLGTLYSTKLFKDFPCTHRQWKAKGHCRFVHGYAREFAFEFACHQLSEQMWVVDFGGLGKVRRWLEEIFDHTFLASEDDPELEAFRELDRRGIIQLRILPNCGMEGTAKYVFEKVNQIIQEETQGRAWVRRVEVRENEKNSAIYLPSQP